MKIISITPISCESVITDESEYNEYIRYGSGYWTVRIGESDEPVYNCADLERLYQKYKLTLEV